MMTETPRPVINLDDVPMREGGNGAAFKAKIGSFGPMIGSTGMGCMLHVVEPGQKAFPFHNHHRIEELFVILEGEGVYRFGSDRHPIKAGDVCAAPTGGPEKAHQIINTGETTLRYLGISTKADTEVVEYPDSGKFAVMSRFDWGNPAAGGIRYVGRPGESLDYFEGEQ
jgi:uncharacterized cupin superfamily protein